jgi:hypothetical protein
MTTKHPLLLNAHERKQKGESRMIKIEKLSYKTQEESQICDLIRFWLSCLIENNTRRPTFKMLIKLIEPKIDNISQSIGPDMVHGLLDIFVIVNLQFLNNEYHT